MFKYIYISVLALTITLIVVLNWSNIKQNKVVRDVVTHFVRSKPAVVPPPFETLGHGARLPTPQELAQEKIFFTQRVELAGQWLKSPNAHQRIIGAEQLSAYESSASEQYLIDTLRHDIDPEVREAAARSLSSFKNLSDHTVSALLKTLGDSNKTIRIATLNTLFSYALRVRFDAKKTNQLLSKLRKMVRSGHINKDVRESLQAFIKDQKPTTNAFFSPQPVQKSIPVSK